MNIFPRQCFFFPIMFEILKIPITYFIISQSLVIQRILHNFSTNPRSNAGTFKSASLNSFSAIST